MIRPSLFAALLLSVTACAGEPPRASEGAPGAIAAELVEEYMRTLSSDAFMGRGPGHRGGRLAADYIAGRFEELGLEPLGGSYFQPFPIVGATPRAGTVELSFEGPGGRLAPTYLDDFVLNPGDPLATSAAGEAEIVFVGYGVDAPEAGWNDFEGVDVSGKFILMLVNDPPATENEPERFGAEAMTYYGRWTYKYEEAARQGALGALVIHETGPAGYPWSVVRGGFAGEQFALPPDPALPRPPTFLGWVSTELARELLRLGGHDFDALKARAGTRGFTAVETGVTATGLLESDVRRVETQNVVGVLPGSSRPEEHVIVTAHYDHFGIGEPVDGDSIYNGAYDNASGTALVMAMAQAMAAAPARPARSVLFMATGAEEQGLLGTEWYVQSPLLPLDRAVAEVNIDGANLWGRTTDVVVHGEERSELGAYVRRRAAEMGLEIVPDPAPENGLFFRSDHFPLAKAGVPALWVEHGRLYAGRPEDWGDEIQTDYTANHYHAPSDEFSEEFVFDGAVQQGTLAMLTVLDLARDETWPNWHEGQEFRAPRDQMVGGP